MVAITSRAQWGANPLTTPASRIATPTSELWLHHTGSTGLRGASGMRSLQAGAISGGYVDVEYSFVADNPGAVFEARGPGRNTAATGGRNEISSAICVFGNFDPATGNQQPTDELIATLGELVAQGAAAGWWPRAITGPHSAAPGNATACCGANLARRIPEINARAAGGAPAPGPSPTPGGDDVPGDKEFVDALSTSDGAWRLQYDGGVETIRGSFFGSYFTLPDSVRNDPRRRFLAISANVDGGRGYSLVSLTGETYTFATPR